MFSNFDLILVMKFAIGELLIGIVAGLIFKQISRSKASQDRNCQILKPTDYNSIMFGSNLPRHFGDAFLLPPEFVITQSLNGETISEEFFTFLGTSSKFLYEQRRFMGGGFSILTCPVYLMTAVIPILIGFFPSFFLPSLLPFVGNFFIPLLYSGVIWLFLTFLIQMVVGSLRQLLNKPG